MGLRVGLLVAAMMAVLAATIDGTRGRQDRGTGRARPAQRPRRRRPLGLGSADTLNGGGRDTIYTGPKGESARGAGAGNDVVGAFNRPASRDVIDCGPGFDRVTADLRDVLDGRNRVSRP